MQIAVTLPDDQVEELDQLVPGTFRSRAEAVRAAVEALLQERRAVATDKAFEEGYGRLPQTDDERAMAINRPSTLWDDLEW